MSTATIFKRFRDAASSTFSSARSYTSDTLGDRRFVGRVVQCSAWTMVFFAVLSTMALWVCLDEKYGENGVLVRYVRGDVDNAGLMESLHDLSGQIEGIYSRERTVDLKAKQSSHGQICPEIDIPGSENNLTHILNVTNYLNAEEIVLQTHTIDARRLTAAANKRLKKIYRSILLDEPRSPRRIPDALDTGLDVDDYILVPGGHWIPAKCTPRWKVAIVIPFRDRHYHLPILLRHMVPFLKAQYLEFAIFIVEQANDLRFNRAMLMNVGFLEALNYTRFDCFIFHDVDHIPLSFGNYYGCGGMPRHFISGVDRWKYKLIYNSFFGAVTGFTRSQIERFNGFPNVYWGWGGEDDEILGRIRAVGLAKSRPWGPVGYYKVIPHHHKSAKKNMDRVCLLRHYGERLDTDGLNNIHYPTPYVQLYPLYTSIVVDIQELPWNPNWTECDRLAELAAEMGDTRPKSEEEKAD